MGNKGFKLSNLRWWILGMDALLLALNYGDRAALGIGAPHIIKEFGFSNTVWGIIIGAFSFGYAPFCFVGGWTSDKFGPRKIMALAAFWWSLFTALTAVGVGFISFLILRILFGFGEGPQGSVTAKTMGNWFPQREMGAAMGISQASTPLGGAICTPIVAWMIAASGSWRLPFIILGAIGIVCAIGWYIVVRDKPEQHPWITAKELAYLNGGDFGKRPEFAADGTVPPVSKYLKQPLVWSTAFAFFGYAWVLFTFLSWFPIYLVQARHLDIKSLAISASIPWITGTIGMAIGGVITDWIGRKTGNPAKARKWFMVICLIGVGITFAPSAMVQSVTGAVTLMAISVFLLYLTGAQYFSIIADLVPSSRIGGVAGFVHFIANTAGIVAPIITGALVTSTGQWGWGFGIGAIVIAIGALGMAFFGKIDKMEDVPDQVQGSKSHHSFH
jgi:MFS transporter, ACS family, hexuronate transporter